MIAVLGAGAFGTALAASIGRVRPVALWGRNLAADRENSLYSGLPAQVSLQPDLAGIDAGTILLAVPAQALGQFVTDNAAALRGRDLVACCKGVDLTLGLGPVGVIRSVLPEASAAILTGPSFAADIARGLPTALTLACADDALGARLQADLSTPNLRLYRTTDVIGAELGGALKNVIAIAAGVVIGAGLGDSARAALMTRGYAEMGRLAAHFGARAETLAGLSGLGDLVLTCTSAQSRNFRHGLALGSGTAIDTAQTVEGVASAEAVDRLASSHGLSMPITAMVAALTQGQVTLPDAIRSLMSRPLKPE